MTQMYNLKVPANQGDSLACILMDDILKYSNSYYYYSNLWWGFQNYNMITYNICSGWNALKLHEIYICCGEQSIIKLWFSCFGSFAQTWDFPNVWEFKRFPVEKTKKPDWGSHFCWHLPNKTIFLLLIIGQSKQCLPDVRNKDSSG